MKIHIGNIIRNLPEDVQRYISIIEKTALESQKEVFLVGGPLRDLLLNRNNIDIDIVVKDDGMQFATLLVNKVGGSINLYKERLTASILLPDNKHIDVATMRTEVYERPGALPIVKPVTDIVKDLSRRDFTINAMAIKLNTENEEEIIDPFNGYKDLKASLIRFLHTKSFIDDPTRIYRAIRFETRFGFKIEEMTLKAMKHALSTNALKTVSGQRCLKEINLFLQEKDPFAVIKRAHELGAMSDIISDPKALTEIKNIFDSIKDNQFLNQETKRLLMLTSLFVHHSPSEITNLSNHFGMTRKQRNDILDTRLLLDVLKKDHNKLDQIIKRYSDHARLLAYMITKDDSLKQYINLQ
ncbi:MAG: CCA tRNA nucleotidyltransferase [bacterium]